MWESLLSWVRFLWNAGVQTERNTSEIEALVVQNRQLTDAMKLLVLQQEHDRQINQQRIESLEREIETLKRTLDRELRDAQEKTELRLRLEISERMRQLPPAEKPNKD